MQLRSAVGLTLLCFLALFAFQLLWTQDRLEHLRDLGRRGLHIRRAARRHQLELGAEQIGARLDRLASAGTDRSQVAFDAAATDANSGIAGDGGLRGGPHAMANPAIIVFCYNRTDYLNQTLHSLLGLQGLQRYSLYISQAGAAWGQAGVCRLAAMQRCGPRRQCDGAALSPLRNPQVHSPMPAVLPCTSRRMAIVLEWRSWWASWGHPCCALRKTLPFGKRRHAWRSFLAPPSRGMPGWRSTTNGGWTACSTTASTAMWS